MRIDPESESTVALTVMKDGSDVGQRAVIVVGAGLVGLSSAYYLRKAGASVTVLERGIVGGGASRFNAGEITTSVSPLPGPDIVKEVAGTIFRSDGAVRITPSQLVRGSRFFFRFLRNCTGATYDSRTAALIALNRLSFEFYDGLAAAGIVTDMHTGGYLVCTASRAAAEAARQHYLEAPYEATSPGPLLDEQELRGVEPALSKAARCGFIRPDERWIDPSRFVDRLATALREMGVEIVEKAAVSGLETTASGMRVESSIGAFLGDSVVLAAGIWSDNLCRGLGTALGMEPGKGYSFTVPVETAPQRLIIFSDQHVVATPLDGRVRIAGTMEFDGTREVLNPRRIEAMVAAVKDFLPGADWDHIRDKWVAPRPMTPDGLPNIGRLRTAPRVIVATGHNMLGLTLAPATGSVVTDLVLARDPGIDLMPFDPHRFS